MKLKDYKENDTNRLDIFLNSTDSILDILDILCWPENKFSAFDLNDSFKEQLNFLTNFMIQKTPYREKELIKLRKVVLIFSNVKQNIGYNQLLFEISSLCKYFKENRNFPRKFYDSFPENKEGEFNSDKITKIKNLFGIDNKILLSYCNSTQIDQLIEIYKCNILEPEIILKSFLNRKFDIFKMKVNLFEFVYNFLNIFFI